jgi:hypothetical protein
MSDTAATQLTYTCYLSLGRGERIITNRGKEAVSPYVIFHPGTQRSISFLNCKFRGMSGIEIDGRDSLRRFHHRICRRAITGPTTVAGRTMENRRVQPAPYQRELLPLTGRV